MDKRGPKIGDAASLWNFTPSPGWTKEESLILKLCLMKFGIGQWIQIQATGLLPGKLIQQLNGATQRLLGQQSLAAFSGLRLDVDRVRADNAARTDARRKNGLIIWGGPNPTKDMRLQWQQEARDKYSLTQDQQREVEAAFEAMAAAAAAAAVPPQGAEDAAAGGTAALRPVAGAGLTATAAAAAHERLPSDILGCDVEQLSLGQKQLLLCALHQRLQQVLGEAVQRLPHLAQLVTFQQQQQQQDSSNGNGSSSWIVAGLPGAAAGSAADAGAAVSSGSAAAAAAVAAAAGFDSDASKQPSRARQASTAAARAGGQQPGAARSKGSSKASSSSRKPPAGGGSKKRSRSKAAAAAADDDDADDAEAAFLRRQQQQRRRRMPAGGSSGRSGGGGASAGSGLFADMLRAALEAGVAQLVDMGYSRSKALDALRECDCDVEAAVEFLTAACC